jgi:hypothetical protein
LEPDQQRFTLLWRASIALRRDVFDLREVIVGMTAKHWRRREARKATGKMFFSSLESLAAWNRQSAANERKAGW